MNFDELEFEKDRVAESIVEDLKNGIISWHDRTSRFVPFNPASNIFYTGVNRFLFYGISKEKGYDIPYFCTQKQAEEKGWSIKDGQQPETLVMIKEYENKIRVCDDSSYEPGKCNDGGCYGFWEDYIRVSGDAFEVVYHTTADFDSS